MVISLFNNEAEIETPEILKDSNDGQFVAPFFNKNLRTRINFSFSETLISSMNLRRLTRKLKICVVVMVISPTG